MAHRQTVAHKGCVTLPVLTPFQPFTVVFTHRWKYGRVNQVGVELCVRTALLNHSENIPYGKVRLRKTQQPYEIEIDHLIDFFSFLRAHVRLLYISTIKHQTSNTKPTELSRHRSK